MNLQFFNASWKQKMAPCDIEIDKNKSTPYLKVIIA